MSKEAPKYISSPSYRAAKNELIGLLIGFVFLVLFGLGLIWLALTLTGGAN